MATRFAKQLGNGRPKKGEPKSTFISRVTAAAVEDLKEIGSFRKTSGGELFYILEKPTGAVIPLANDSIQLHTLVQRRFNVNAASREIYSALLTGFQVEAFQFGKEVIVHQFSHSDIESKTLYVSLLDEGSMLKIDAAGVKQVTNGTDGVFFLDPPNWKPWKLVENYERGIAKRLLVDSLDFADTPSLRKNDQALLYEMWIKGLFLDPSNKPLLALVGPSQAGKTSNLECVKATIAGPAGKAETVSKEDAFKAAVAADPLFIIDNLDEIDSPWLSEALCGASTGANITLRALYKTNTKYSTPPRAYIAMTSTNTDFLKNKTTLANRSIVLEVAPHARHRDPDEHRALILKQRDEILTDLVMQLPTYVKAWRAEKETAKTTFRMSSFELLVRRFVGDERSAALFEKLSNAQSQIETENNSLILTLDHYFRTHEQDSVRLNAAEFNLHLQHATGEEKWTTKGLGRAIKKQQSTLQKRYGMREDGWKNGTQAYVYHRPSDITAKDVQHPVMPESPWASVQ